MKVSKTTQIRVTAADKPGQLAKVLKMIADAGVNGIAYAGYVVEGKGHIMIVTADNAAVMPLLKQAGYEVREEPVVLVVDADRRGNAMALADRIAKANVNLTEAYATAAGGEYATVLRTADVDQLLAALR